MENQNANYMTKDDASSSSSRRKQKEVKKEIIEEKVVVSQEELQKIRRKAFNETLNEIIVQRGFDPEEIDRDVQNQIADDLATMAANLCARIIKYIKEKNEEALTDPRNKEKAEESLIEARRKEIVEEIVMECMKENVIECMKDKDFFEHRKKETVQEEALTEFRKKEKALTEPIKVFGVNIMEEVEKEKALTEPIKVFGVNIMEEVEKEKEIKGVGRGRGIVRGTG